MTVDTVYVSNTVDVSFGWIETWCLLMSTVMLVYITYLLEEKILPRLRDR